MIKKYQAELNNAYVDHFYDFTGQWDVPSRCGIKIIRTTALDIVIATEIYHENPGTSVTQFCSKLASLIVNDFELDPKKLCFIVRTPESNSKLSFLNETFAQAHMEWDGARFGKPGWEPMSKDKINALISKQAEYHSPPDQSV
jgi:hypothetical protein